MSTNKSLSRHLFNENGHNLVELLKGKQFYKVMDKFMPLCYANILWPHNII
jgi:hypothetical protein